MSIWNTKPTIEQLNKGAAGCIHDALGITMTEIGPDYLEGSMPVDHRTKNPVGILHGGASVVLAESLGSLAAALVAGLNKRTMGIEINATHLKSAKEGTLFGRATPIRIGKTLQVWEIRIRREHDLKSELICISRLTVMTQDT